MFLPATVRDAVIRERGAQTFRDRYAPFTPGPCAIRAVQAPRLRRNESDRRAPEPRKSSGAVVRTPYSAREASRAALDGPVVERLGEVTGSVCSSTADGVRSEEASVAEPELR